MSDFFLADDLSGALDAAAAFHHAGRRVSVVLTVESWGTATGEVVGLTTETRNAAPVVAAATITQVLAEARRRGGRLLYKKIDSTLRGPVAAEIAALVAALPEAAILFTPANPDVGRTVRNGVLLVHGVPVAETEFARDPVSPVKESNLCRLIGGAGSARVVIADAETEEDLTEAVAHMDAGGGTWIGVGSGALARPIAARVARTRKPRADLPGAVPASPALMICGSAHPGNRAQAAALARDRGVPIHEFRPDERGPVVARMLTSLRAGRGASLIVEETRGDSGEVLRTLAAAVREIVVDTGTARIFATGGETAFAVCSELGVTTLDFRAELESGLSLSRAAASRGPMLLAIKPGGFGTPESWVRAWDRLHDEN